MHAKFDPDWWGRGTEASQLQIIQIYVVILLYIKVCTDCGVIWRGKYTSGSHSRAKFGFDWWRVCMGTEALTVESLMKYCCITATFRLARVLLGLWSRRHLARMLKSIPWVQYTCGCQLWSWSAKGGGNKAIAIVRQFFVPWGWQHIPNFDWLQQLGLPHWIKGMQGVKSRNYFKDKDNFGIK